MTGLSCLSITASHGALDVLERLTYSREELAGRLAFLRINSQARAVAVLSTCQRTEVYATWPGEPDQQALLAALALDRGIPDRVLRPVARTYRDAVPGGHAADGTGLLPGELDAAARGCLPLLDVKRTDMRAVQQAGHERGVHGAHEFSM